MLVRLSVSYSLTVPVLLFVYLAGPVPLIDPSYVFVIIDCAKNNLRKTEYKIANRVAGDSWVKLKRSKDKSGIDFRILRKVELLQSAAGEEESAKAEEVCDAAAGQDTSSQ